MRPEADRIINRMALLFDRIGVRYAAGRRDDATRLILRVWRAHSNELDKFRTLLDREKTS